MTLKQTILKESFHEISTDTKFIRLATITTFVHSLLFLLYLAYLISNIISKMQGTDNQFFAIINTYATLTDVNMTLLIVLWLILLVGYGLLPPVGEASMIHYLDNPKKQGTVSLWRWFAKFFPMFEFDAATSFLQVIVYFIALSRMYVMGIMDSTLVQILIVIWWIIVLWVIFLLPYARFLITLEDYSFFEALKKSVSLSVQHFSITSKFVIVDMLLHLRFVVNILIIVGIPLWLMYLADRAGITSSGLIQSIFLTIVILLFLLTAYITGIIEAFFFSYWYKVYKHIQGSPEDDA